MKVICAGLTKTGTKSLNAALTILGYQVYDCMEHYELLGKQWNEIFQTDGDVSEMIKVMYKDVDAACDNPIYAYWEDALKAFPDAKVILSVRDDWECWFHSMMKQVDRMDSKILPFLTNVFSSSMRNYMRYNILAVRPIFGYNEHKILKNGKVSRTKFRHAYRRHVAYVKQVCPADQLLIFNCKEGWEPLCKFLQLPTPTLPFPHKNIGGEVVEEVLLPSATFQRIRREVAVGITITCMASFAVGFGIWRHFGFTPHW